MGALFLICFQLIFNEDWVKALLVSGSIFIPCVLYFTFKAHIKKIKEKSIEEKEDPLQISPYLHMYHGKYDYGIFSRRNRLYKFIHRHQRQR